MYRTHVCGAATEMRARFRTSKTRLSPASSFPNDRCEAVPLLFFVYA